MMFYYYIFIYLDLIFCFYGIFCCLIINYRDIGGIKNNGILEIKFINGDMFFVNYLFSIGYNNLRSWFVWRGYVDYDLIFVFLSIILKWIVFGEWLNWIILIGLF